MKLDLDQIYREFTSAMEERQSKIWVAETIPKLIARIRELEAELDGEVACEHEYLFGDRRCFKCETHADGW